jgi:HlyD family secretion protein
VGGKPTVYVVGATGVQQPREVELGLDNNRMVRIVSGLQEGERILLAPPLAPSEVRTEVPEIKQPEAVGTGQTEPRGGRSPESGASGKPSPEEIRKRMESLSPEQRKELEKRARERGRSSQGEADKPPSEKQ